MYNDHNTYFSIPFSFGIFNNLPNIIHILKYQRYGLRFQIYRDLKIRISKNCTSPWDSFTERNTVLLRIKPWKRSLNFSFYLISIFPLISFFRSRSKPFLLQSCSSYTILLLRTNTLIFILDYQNQTLIQARFYKTSVPRFYKTSVPRFYKT